jgi:hypothetical protein
MKVVISRALLEGLLGSLPPTRHEDLGRFCLILK